MTTVRITSSSGRIQVVAEDRADVHVEGAARVDRGDVVEVSGTSGAMTVRVPTGTDLFVGTASGRVDLDGPLGDVSVTAHSGRIEVERCATLDARSKSGRITAEAVAGPCRCNSVSGRIEVTLVEPADVQADSVSGAVRVVVPQGMCPHVVARTVSGREEIEAPSGGDAELQLRTVSGSISVVCER